MSLRISWSRGIWLPVQWRLDKNQRGVALTIDDAPMPDTTPMLLDLLEHHRATASFFLSGCRVAAHPGLAAEIHARGHAIYAHGWDHIRLDQAGPERLRADMARCEALLAEIRPTPKPYLIRLPYNGGWRNRMVHRTLAEWQPGCRIVHWSAPTEDHLIAPRCVTPADVEHECTAQADRLLADPALPGSIVLMHDQPINERPGAEFKPAVTVTLMRQLLEGFERTGLHTVPITGPDHQPFWSRFAMVW